MSYFLGVLLGVLWETVSLAFLRNYKLSFFILRKSEQNERSSRAFLFPVLLIFLFAFGSDLDRTISWDKMEFLQAN